MFNLSLDIDYIAAALALLIVLYASSRRKFSNVTKANRMFYKMVFASIVTCVIDLVMNVVITYTSVIPDIIYMLVRLAFNCGTCTITYLGYLYARMYQGEERSRALKVLDTLTIVMFAAYVLLSFVNIFTGLIAYIDENGVYQHGPLFLLNTIVPALIFVNVLVLLITHSSDYTKTQRHSIAIQFALTFVFVGIELVTHNIAPLTMFGISLSLVIIQQSLVSPELLDLRKSLEEQKVISEEARTARVLAEEARAEAEDANKAKSSFLARMSHEIRTPLNAVIGFNSIISKETSDETIRTYSMDAKMAGENLLSLINDILDFSKIESGKLEIIDADYSFAEIMREEYLMFTFKAGGKGLKLEFDIDSQIPSGLYGDDIRIKQILTNILSNAVKYTEKGTVKLKAELISKEDGKANIKFSVTDTGMGIKEENLGKLFDAFERIEEKRNRRIEGTGLGVNICASLLNMMDSKLMVSSTYGEGSCFYFTIAQKVINDTPVGDFNPGSEKSVSVNEDPDAIEAHGAKVLVVDDTPLNIKVFKGLLKKSGISVDSAESGEKSLEMAQDTKYDIIFMDHLMPGMDGIEAMKLIKARKDCVNKDTPIVVLTANAIKGAYEEYIEYGFTDALFKPVKMAELNSVLKKYLK